jgi:hypothetical protein
MWSEFFETLYANEFNRPRQGRLIFEDASIVGQSLAESSPSNSQFNMDEELDQIIQGINRPESADRTSQPVVIDIGEVWCNRCGNKSFSIETGMCVVCDWQPGPSY